jgi:hypothetical protein
MTWYGRGVVVKTPDSTRTAVESQVVVVADQRNGTRIAMLRRSFDRLVNELSGPIRAVQGSH